MHARVRVQLNKQNDEKILLHAILVFFLKIPQPEIQNLF